MTRSIIAAVQPARVTLEAGRKYAFCVCGRSDGQPFCDGSHEGTGLQPHIFTAEQDGEYFLCCCKQTGNPPFCDGTHKSLDQAQVGHPPSSDP